MQFLRTPDDRFSNLPGYSFKPNYLNVSSADGTELRMHYVDEGNPDALPVLLLHGEPSWSYLYRKMIPILSGAGYRVLAPDLIGFGRSDKPARRVDYTYSSHLDWLTQWFDKMALENVILFCQDWGGLLGLRVVANQPERFAGVIAANTFLPTGDVAASEAFLNWQSFSQTVPEFPAGGIVQGATVSELSDAVRAAYDAPFPDEAYKEGARQFPMLVPVSPDNPESEANRKAWEALKNYQNPFLTAFSDQDPVTAGAEDSFQSLIPGCQGQKHTTIREGGHFLQEDQGEQLAKVIVDFIADNNLGAL